jgi:hypothetical protein
MIPVKVRHNGQYEGELAGPIIGASNSRRGIMTGEYKSTMWHRVAVADCEIVSTIVGEETGRVLTWKVKGPGFTARYFNRSQAGNVYWRSTGKGSDRYGNGIIIEGM